MGILGLNGYNDIVILEKKHGGDEEDRHGNVAVEFYSSVAFGEGGVLGVFGQELD